MSAPLLIVLAGLPGTGKTTLARLLAGQLRAALLRVDAIEAAVVSSELAEHPVGVVGYVAMQNVASECLRVGTSVVVDAVHPVPESREPWSELEQTTGSRLLFVEVTLADEAQRRRRVEGRAPDHPGQAQPTWEQANRSRYVAWDEQRLKPRIVVDGADCDVALAQVLSAIDDRDGQPLMQPRISLITLGVTDLARSRAFYEALGWRGQEVEETYFVQAGGQAVVLWSRQQLAADAGVADGAGFDGLTLAHNVRSRAEVDAIIAAAEEAGARITKPAAETFYGGYAGYFADPDGHLWEIAHNPGFTLEPDGSLTLPDFSP